jgi:hypothetical protein
MNTNEYIKHLQALVKRNPKAGKLQVFYASDSEGNSFSPVTYKPDSFGLPNHMIGLTPKDKPRHVVVIN